MKLSNIFKKAGLAAVFLLSAHVAQAGAPPASFSFGATVLEGSYAGTMGYGSVSYDFNSLTGGIDALYPGEGLFELSLTILGQTFSMADDVEFPAFPVVSFDNYMPTLFDFLVVEDGVEILEPNVVSIGLGEVIGGLTPGSLCTVIDGNGCYDYYVEAFVNVAKIPEVPVPAALWLFGSGLLGLAGIARKKKVA